ncbi:hypothetical protein FVEN_g12820 [Fusarium venenatum]|nr:hypothetical protein FVEN_g12820 [Fusarium venenatum]
MFKNVGLAGHHVQGQPRRVPNNLNFQLRPREVLGRPYQTGSGVRYGSQK